MQSLAREGILVQVPYAGWEVMKLSSQDAWELHTLRSSLEGMAARIAAMQINDAGKITLERAIQNLRQAVTGANPREVAEADLAVHKAIVSISGHHRLVEQYRLVFGSTMLYILSTNRMMERPESILPEHVELVSAILDGDADRAEHLAESHVTSHGKRLVSALKQQEAT